MLACKQKVRTNNESTDNDDATFVRSALRGQKRPFIDTSTSSINDALPDEYRHIRVRAHIIKPEFYKTVDLLISKYHCSKTQAIAAVIETGRVMFGRSNWKFHTENQKLIDLDTAPDKKSIRRADGAIQALSLSCLVKEIMDSDESVITYHTDSSKVQGTGAYSVQGITINGKYRSLPALPISNECRENLSLLKQTILSILSAVSGVAACDLFSKINYQMTDAAAHNLHVDEMVAMDLGVDHVPQHLFCQTHPCLMFNRKLVEVVRDVENHLGTDKIYSSFLVNATTQHATVFEQYLDCVVRLVSPDFDHKPWNYSKMFHLFVAPKKNLAVALKMERFNRFVYLCAVVLYMQDDFHAFLQKHDHISNTLACIVRSFASLDFLSIFCGVGAAIGVHLIQPYLNITYFHPMTYSELIPAMHLLYNDLLNCNPVNLLDLTQPAFNFVSHDRFQQSNTWPKEIVTDVQTFIQLHQSRVVPILQAVLHRMADGFLKQRGHVFGFARGSNEELCLDSSDSNLDMAPINNLDSERDVGTINYELKIHGAKQLACSSKSHVKAKLVDLVELKPKEEFRKHYKNATAVSEIMQVWNDTQLSLMKQGLSSKEAQLLVSDQRKVKDLQFLQEFGGPFSNVDDVDRFLANDNITAEIKKKVMYHQVRFARDTCLSLPKSSDIFRLMKNHQRLETAIYAKNLKTYLSKIQSKATATWEDFDRAVGQLDYSQTS